MSSAEDNSSSEANAKGQQAQNAPDKHLAIQRIYVKDLSFESPRAPQVFSEDWRPEVNVNLNSQARTVGPELFEVELVVTVTVNVGTAAAFLVEVHQAGVFQLAGFAEDELSHVLGSYCPNILFPYAREVVSDLTTKGGFPQFLLAPVNFDALYAQHMQAQQAPETPDASSH